MREGENALAVINRVKAKLADVKPSLPSGVEVVTTYDRSDLIERAIDTVKVGGLVTSFIMELLVYPPIYLLWRKRQLTAVADAAGTDQILETAAQ